MNKLHDVTSTAAHTNRLSSADTVKTPTNNLRLASIRLKGLLN